MQCGISINNTSTKPFLPSSLAGLMFWLNASRGISLNGSAVSCWSDQSGNGIHFLQSTALLQPLFVASAFRAFPGVSFNGTSSEMETIQTGIFTLTGAFTIVIAFKRNTAGCNNYETILSQGYGVTQHAIAFGLASNGNISPAPAFVTDMWKPSGIQADISFTATSPTVVSFTGFNWQEHKTSGAAIRMNGVPQMIKSYGSGVPQNVQNMPVRLGSFGPLLSQGYFNGIIGEVLVYQRLLDLEEMVKVERYLMRKFIGAEAS